MSRGPEAEIDLAALLHNFVKVKELAGGLPAIAVVKADAYGHGAVEVSKALERAGVSALAVAFTSEAEQLREAGVNAPIIVLFDCTDVRKCFMRGLTPVVHDLGSARALSGEVSKKGGGAALDVHVKMDTGMGRLGLASTDELLKVLELENLNIVGLMSHFSNADLSDAEVSALQIKKFKEAGEALAQKGLRPLRHMANSAAVLGLPESHFDAVRPGLMLYGCSPFAPEQQQELGLKPVMRVTARVLAMRSFEKGTPLSYGGTFITARPTLTAVLPVGYADGFTRAFSNNSHVILRGRRAPVVGRVCMDLTLVDVTGIEGVREGDKAVLMGADEGHGGGHGGEQEITPWELARAASTIPYEILTSMGRGAQRVFAPAEAEDGIEAEDGL